VRELELTIYDAIRAGLSPLDVTPVNSDFLSKLLGFRCGKGQPELYDGSNNPLPTATDLYYNWPFPQFISGKRYNVLVVRDSVFQHEDKVYIVSDDHSTVTEIFAIDALTFGVGTLMEVADFGAYAIMVNGVIIIYWDPDIGDWREITGSDNIPLIRTICNFKGQAVGGNVVNGWKSLDETFYVWSRIGYLNFYPERTNEAGFRRCPYGGEVYHARRLGDSVIGYSSKGICMMTPVGSPAATFRFDELSDVGLINQGAMNGSLDGQIYVGSDHRLYGVSRQGVKELGYKKFIEELDGEDIIITYDKANKDYYIGNSEKTFLLSPYGMSEVPQHPSAVWSINGNTYMLPDAEDNYLAEINSEVINFGYGGQKTIFSMESDIFTAMDPQVAVDYTYDLMHYESTKFVPLNSQGIASIIASGNAFRLKIRFDPTYLGTNISYIKARYKMTDLRGLRGIYAPPPRGQSYVD